MAQERGEETGWWVTGGGWWVVGTNEDGRLTADKCPPLTTLHPPPYHIHSSPSDTPCAKMVPLVLMLLTGLAANWSCSGARATPVIHMKS